VMMIRGKLESDRDGLVGKNGWIVISDERDTEGLAHGLQRKWRAKRAPHFGYGAASPASAGEMHYAILTGNV
jgi:hypothetical protein